MNTGDPSDTLDNDFLEFSDDPVILELQSIQATFPQAEIRINDRVGKIAIPMKSDTPILLQLEANKVVLNTRHVYHLPPLVLEFEIPAGYPGELLPKFTLTSQIVLENVLKEMQKSLEEIWISYKDHVLFSAIDFLLEKSQNELSLLIGGDSIGLNDQLFHACIEFDRDQFQLQFNNSSFSCQICQNDHNGTACLKFEPCGHIFCKSCLNDYFKSIIVSGDIDKVHCPDFSCTKDHVVKLQEYSDLNKWVMKVSEVENIVNSLLTPNVLLNFLAQIVGDQPELINRYYELHKKAQFEFIGKLLPNRLVSCPRTGCDEIIFRKDLSDQLVVCQKCGYAFCNNCRSSWHTKWVICKSTKASEDYFGVPVEEIKNYLLYDKDSYEKKTLNSKYGRNIMIQASKEYEMDLLFDKMLQEESSVVKCPRCEIVVEKIDGCNKMKCLQCFASFCFLCGLITDNNYDHFADIASTCYNKLFNGMPGIDDWEEDLEFDVV